MAGQAPNRRQVLQALACASLASGAPGLCTWAYAFAEPSPAEPQMAHHAASPSATHPVHYVPKFFKPAEYETIVTVAELILPRTASPQETTRAVHAAAVRHQSVPAAQAGATDAGVAEFIDFMVSRDAVLQPMFCGGLAWLNSAAAHGDFHMLPTADQASLLERIAYKKNFRDTEKAGQEFFSVMRRYTVMGFYTSRIGLESLDYPGLRFYASSPTVPQDGFFESLGVAR